MVGPAVRAWSANCSRDSDGVQRTRKLVKSRGAGGGDEEGRKGWKAGRELRPALKATSRAKMAISALPSGPEGDADEKRPPDVCRDLCEGGVGG